MKKSKIIALTAESYAEEQYLLNKFPISYWRPGDGIQRKYATFYINEIEEKRVDTVMTEWTEVRKRIAKELKEDA